jgi:uncharacterized membrane protein YhaH (DUF805 family)
MNFVEAISSCFRNYANFSGRAVRSEYWYWYLFVAIVLIVFGAIDQSLYPAPLEMGPFSYVTMAVVLALILPSLAVSVRRLHDIDRTGWWVLIAVTGTDPQLALAVAAGACNRSEPSMQRGPDLSKAVRTRRAWQACPVDQDKRADASNLAPVCASFRFCEVTTAAKLTADDCR